jgi:hypothetical protein
MFFISPTLDVASLATGARLLIFTWELHSGGQTSLGVILIYRLIS